MQEKKILINNLLINYYTLEANSDNPTLIFLHGWRSNGTVWFEAMKQLSNQGYTCYSLDLPGFGKSQSPSSSYTLSDYCEIVKEFIEKLKLENVVLVGHSFGGRITIKLTSKYNLKQLNSIVLVDSGGIYHTSEFTKFKKILASIVRPIFKPSFMQPLRQRIYQSIGAEDYLATRYLQNTFENIVSEDLTPLLSDIKCKTLIVWGEKDENEYTPLSDAKLMNQKIGASILEVIPNAGHYCFLDDKESFVEILLKFLA